MITVDELKSRLSMRDVATRYGFEPDRSDCIKCPFHADTHPSLHIYAEPGRGFYCYACDSGGSVVDFVMRLFRINYRQALLRIGSDFGYSDEPTNIEAERRMRAEQAARRLTEQRQQQNLTQLAADHCSAWQTLKRDEPAARLLLEYGFPPPDEWARAWHAIDQINYRQEVLECRK